MQEQTKTQATLSQKMKVEDLPIKKLIPAGLSESLRPVASLKRRKTLRPKIMLPLPKKHFN